MKIGIITFHNSYNCGSMLQTFALHNVLKKYGLNNEIIDFSNEGQKNVYNIFCKINNIKAIAKNLITLLCYFRLKANNASYENFKHKHFTLSNRAFISKEELSDEEYDIVIAGSDQIWNITIEDGDDAYFLPWVKQAKKIAYAPSFGARDIAKYTNDKQRYIDYLNSFSYLSIREKNGQTWLKQLLNKDVQILLDPTLLLDADEYDKILEECHVPEKYIFYYAPGYDKSINKLVEEVSKKYSLPVIAFNTKSYFWKGMFFSSFKLPSIENPAVYLYLIKNASIIFTTSFHGSIFSSIYRKCFWTIKNGEMFGDDDRVLSLFSSLALDEHLIDLEFNVDFDYLKCISYNSFEEKLQVLRKQSLTFLQTALFD